MEALRDSNHRPPLSVAGLTFNYGPRRALDDVAFDVRARETVILLGPNGAGKTTLFSLISGLFAPHAGSISICGKTLSRAGASALDPLGIVFQAQTLDLDLTVRQNLRYFCALHGMSRAAAERRIGEELTRLKMADRIDEKIRALNGGHRRRVEIARAVAHNPKILLLDEPTVGLDIPTRRELIADLHARAADSGVALLWATHLIDEVAETDKVIVLHKGKVARIGTPADLRAATGTPNLDAAFAALTAAEAAA